MLGKLSLTTHLRRRLRFIVHIYTVHLPVLSSSSLLSQTNPANPSTNPTQHIPHQTKPQHQNDHHPVQPCTYTRARVTTTASPADGVYATSARQRREDKDEADGGVVFVLHEVSWGLEGWVESGGVGLGRRMQSGGNGEG